MRVTIGKLSVLKSRSTAVSQAMHGGLSMCHCVQTLSDDLIFYYYQVWASKKDFFKHIKSDVVKPLGEFIVDKVRPTLEHPRHRPAYNWLLAVAA